MKSLKNYFIAEAKSTLPSELSEYADICKFGDWDELEDKDFEKIYDVLMKIESPASWNTAKVLLQYLHDGDLDTLEGIAHGSWHKGDKATQKEAEKIEKAINKLPNKMTDNYSELGGLINYTSCYFFNKLNPKKKVDGYYDDLSRLFLNIRYFDKYFTDKAKEAARKKEIDALPENMKEWRDKCRSFCYAGAWNYTEDPKLNAMDFKDFLIDAKEFDFEKIKDLGQWQHKIIPYITKLLHALIDKDKNAVLSAFDEYKSHQGGHSYWYQNDFTRDNNGGCIVEASLIIAMAKFLGAGSNLWYGSDVDDEGILRKIKTV